MKIRDMGRAVNTVNIVNIVIIMGILFLSTLLPAAALQGDEPLVNGTSIYLSTGQTWTFYQGYSIILMSVSNSGDRAWVQLKLNDTVVKSALVSTDEVLYYNSTTHYNLSNHSIDTVQFSLIVSGIYSGEDVDIVTFSHVYQYSNPALPEPTPTPTVHPNDSNNSNGTQNGTLTTADGPGIPGFGLFSTTIIICICNILLRRLNK